MGTGYRNDNNNIPIYRVFLIALLRTQ